MGGSKILAIILQPNRKQPFLEPHFEIHILNFWPCVANAREFSNGEDLMKKIYYAAKKLQRVPPNSPQLKKAGFAVIIGAALLFGLAAVAVIALAIVLFQLVSNTNITLDVNQLFSQVGSWFGGIFGAGQEALQNAPVKIEVSPPSP